jgi:hypothetical protein
MTLKAVSLLLVLLLAFQMNRSSAQDNSIRTVAAKANYYPSISLLSAGERVFLDYDDEKADPTKTIAGYCFRFVVVTSEVYDRIYLEKVVFGPEGSNTRIVSVRALDLEDFADTFKMKGEISGITFSKWLSASSCQFTLYGRTFTISDIGKATVSVTEASGGS